MTKPSGLHVQVTILKQKRKGNAMTNGSRSVDQ